MTSTDEADCTQEPGLSVVHLQRQELPSESKHQVCERPKASVVHLCSVEGQPVREGHGVLLWSVASTDTQHLQETKHQDKVNLIKLKLTINKYILYI